MKDKLLIWFGGLLVGIGLTWFFFCLPLMRYDVNRDGKVSVDDMLKVQEYYLNH